MRDRREPVEVTYDDLEHETPDARKFIIDGEVYWIPKGQMTDWDMDAKTFVIPEWLAFEKGLI